MVGVLENAERCCGAAFTNDDDIIALVGPPGDGIDASEYQLMLCDSSGVRPPAVDMTVERKVQGFVREAVGAGLLRSAHDCSDGGLAVALAESCLLGDRGAWVGLEDIGWQSADPARQAAILFGESPSRFVVSFPREALLQLHEMSSRHEVPFAGLGSVGGARFVVTDCLDVALDLMRTAYEGALDVAE